MRGVLVKHLRSLHPIALIWRGGQAPQASPCVSTPTRAHPHKASAAAGTRSSGVSQGTNSFQLLSGTFIPHTPMYACHTLSCTAAHHGVLQSAKLRQAQEQAQNLTKEKESLMQVIQELKARIKQGAHRGGSLCLCGRPAAMLPLGGMQVAASTSAVHSRADRLNVMHAWGARGAGAWPHTAANTAGATTYL